MYLDTQDCPDRIFQLHSSSVGLFILAVRLQTQCTLIAGVPSFLHHIFLLQALRTTPSVNSLSHVVRCLSVPRPLKEHFLTVKFRYDSRCVYLKIMPRRLKGGLRFVQRPDPPCLQTSSSHWQLSVEVHSLFADSNQFAISYTGGKCRNAFPPHVSNLHQKDLVTCDGPLLWTCRLHVRQFCSTHKPFAVSSTSCSHRIGFRRMVVLVVFSQSYKSHTYH